MNRILNFLYGTVSYALSLAVFAYLAGFIGNFAVLKSMDSPAEGPWLPALLIDLGLVLLFAIQHSVMARPGFKRALTKVVPEAIERSTYVLASNLALIVLFWQWRPLGGSIWEVQNDIGVALLYSGYAFGWALLLFVTFLLNHFDLFGLRQVWRNLLRQPQADLKFGTPFLYRIVRHPLYIGWLCIFWITPAMTVTHLFFALGMTGYILFAIHYEERDLIAKHPEYAEYRRQVPMLVPGMPRSVMTSGGANRRATAN